jgi:DNA invertase Pin-like site-specific DNA recombinase
MLSHIRQGDHAIFYSVDRAARNLRDFCNTIWDLERRGVYIHYINDQINSATAVGKFQLNMRAAAAQFFSDLISERTREALAIRRMMDGKKPFVTKSRTKWVANPELAVVAAPAKLDRPVNRILQYERVSTDRQYVSGLGLEHQSLANQRAAERLHQEHGGIIDRVFSDPAVSAFSKRFGERAGGKALLEYAQPGDDVVIYRIDRAWRNPADAIDMAQRLMERNVYLHFVSEGIRTDTKQGAEWISVLAAMAHMESTLRSVRVCKAMEECRRQGRKTGGDIPRGRGCKTIKAGYKKLVLNPDDIVYRCQMLLMKEELGLGDTKVAEAMVALHCYDRKEKATLKHRKNWKVWTNVEFCKRTRDTLSPTLWEDIAERARKRLHIPIARHHWYRPKWDDEYKSVAEMSYSLSAR